MALEFYKEYNMEYYNTIIKNIQSRRIIKNINIVFLCKIERDNLNKNFQVII